MMVFDGPNDVRLMTDNDIETIILSVRCVLEDLPAARIAREEYLRVRIRAKQLERIAERQNVISDSKLRQYVYRQALEERLTQLLLVNREEINRLYAA